MQTSGAHRLRRHDNMFFDSWAQTANVVIASSVVFLFIVGVLRLVGPQALAKMSPFDIVFTVTLGSVVGSVALAHDVALCDGIVAIITLLVLQEAVRWVQSRSLVAHQMVRQPPRMLLWDGILLEDRLNANNISADEVRSAVRRAGLPSLGDAQAVVLENHGEWSVVPKGRDGSDYSALYGLPVPGIPDNSPKSDGNKATAAPTHRLP